MPWDQLLLTLAVAQEVDAEDGFAAIVSAIGAIGTA